MVTVAALYIDPRGPYPKLAALGDWCACSDRMSGGIPCPQGKCPNAGRFDCWDVTRDARKYEGPWPVVAHPPCGPWGRLRHLYRGNEHDCAPRAVEQVRRWGGVLEHPAGSLLWVNVCLPLPEEDEPLGATDAWGGYTIEVDQVEWGHVARKRTWLYVVGAPRDAVAALVAARPFPGREPTHRIGSSTCGRIDGSRYRPASGLKSASAQQRRRTPIAFAEFLIAIARLCERPA